MHEKVTTEKSVEYISKVIGVTHELTAKIASHQELQQITSKIKKI